MTTSIVLFVTSSSCLKQQNNRLST